MPPDCSNSEPTLMTLKSAALLSVSVPAGLRTAIWPLLMAPTLLASLQLLLPLMPTRSSMKLPFHTAMPRGVDPKLASVV